MSSNVSFDEWWERLDKAQLTGTGKDLRLAWDACLAAHPLKAVLTPVIIGVACREAGENLANATKALVSQTRKLPEPPGLLSMAQELADLAVRAWQIAKESVDD